MLIKAPDKVIFLVGLRNDDLNIKIKPSKILINAIKYILVCAPKMGIIINPAAKEPKTPPIVLKL